jgi:hypothetical protein
LRSSALIRYRKRQGRESEGEKAKISKFLIEHPVYGDCSIVMLQDLIPQPSLRSKPVRGALMGNLGRKQERRVLDRYERGGFEE